MNPAIAELGRLYHGMVGARAAAQEAQRVADNLLAFYQRRVMDVTGCREEDLNEVVIDFEAGTITMPEREAA